MVSRALEAAERLRAEGIGLRVLNMPFVDPLDEQAIIDAARETRGIVTAEEATVSGGLGAAVASVVVENQPVPMRILGIRGEFAPTGSAAFLLDHFGLNADGIADAVRQVVAARRLRPMLLAIDQGTSATKALLVDADGGDPRARRGAGRPAASAAGLGGAVGGRDLGERPRGGRGVPRRAGRARRRGGRAQHPARVAGAVGARDRRAARPAAELAGPADGAALRAAARRGRRRARPRAQRPAARPDVLRAQGRMAAGRPRPRPDPQPARRAVPRHGRLVAAEPARRRAT